MTEFPGHASTREATIPKSWPLARLKRHERDSASRAMRCLKPGKLTAASIYAAMAAALAMRCILPMTFC